MSDVTPDDKCPISTFDGKPCRREIKVFYGEVIFTHVRLEKPERVAFRKTNLSRCLFLETNLQEVEFTDEVSGRLGSANVKNRVFSTEKEFLDVLEGTIGYLQTVIYKPSVFECAKVPLDLECPKVHSGLECAKVHLGENKNYSYIERLYRQLRQNHEKSGLYGEAGDFYIGEMEMRRLNKSWIDKYLSTLAFYKYVSNYGEGYKRAGLWAVGLILFAFVFMFIGIEPDIVTEVHNSHLEKFLDSLMYSLAVASFQRTEYFHPMNSFGELLTIVEPILSLIFIALFILAVRRRFKR